MTQISTRNRSTTPCLLELAAYIYICALTFYVTLRTYVTTVSRAAGSIPRSTFVFCGGGLQCCVHTNAHTQACTQTFSPPQKTNVLLGIKPAAPPPSRSPSQDVNPLHQSTTPNNQQHPSLPCNN